MLWIASFLIELLAFALLCVAGFAGYATYRVWQEMPDKSGSLLELVLKSQQLQTGLTATGSALGLFLVCMMAFAVIDTARHTRKVLDQLRQMERV